MKITEFVYPGCPYCIRMKGILTELLDECPELSAMELEIIDETVHPDIAEKYDYYYCPSFFAGDRKIYEQRRDMDVQSSRNALKYALLAENNDNKGDNNE